MEAQDLDYQYVKAYGMGKLYRKAREHFGRNALESDIGKGSIFILEFPE